jgi:transcriptional regulator with XRE-family HTH domain
VSVLKGNNNIVAKRVRKARADRALSQDALSGRLAARGVAIDRAGIAKIETGRRYVSDYEVRALAQALGVSVTWLLGMEA